MKFTGLGIEVELGWMPDPVATLPVVDAGQAHVTPGTIDIGGGLLVDKDLLGHEG
jgi:hypothetical protein